MKAPQLLVFLLSAKGIYAKPNAIEMKTFRDYAIPDESNTRTSPSCLQQQPDLRDPQVLLSHLEQLANRIKHEGKAPANTAESILPFLAYNCNWPILPGLILTVSPANSKTLWNEGQRAFELATQQRKTHKKQRQTKAIE